ncbi:hypothetical protein BDV28DRAFT_127918 [Aspergillus coremiiformis]|uniref:Uncharacterized protein n=1 Tax=Aspergillus coremiiformis TaxID=138285 RepID=A0A5N6ZE61_9EURO|nr:hypothetical protein BDV28DRAFT_127918 [Aspergillus coremiiformis]
MGTKLRSTIVLFLLFTATLNSVLGLRTLSSTGLSLTARIPLFFHTSPYRVLRTLPIIHGRHDS